MSEELKEKNKLFNLLKEMWQKGDSPLHNMYSSWEELKKNIEVKDEIESAESPKEIAKSQVRKEKGTGGSAPKSFKDVIYRFDPYEITVRLSPNNEFIAITEVKVKRDFMSYKEKISTKGYHDVEAFYPE